MAHFKIYKNKEGFYSVLFKMNNSIDFFGTSYDSKAYCFKSIKLIKYLSSQDKAYKIEKAECGSWFFKIVNNDSGKTIGESQTYLNKAILDKQIMMFKKALPLSKIDSQIYSL